MQTLKTELHQKSLKLHHVQKDIEVHELEVKQSHKNLNFVAEEQSKLRDEQENIKKDRKVFRDKVAETETKVELLEDYVEDLKEYEDRHDKE